MMAGDDDLALPLWEGLHTDYPDVALFADALAHSHRTLEEPAQGAQVLLAGLESDSASTRVLAARTLLTEDFFYLLDDANLDMILTITEGDSLDWGYLATFDQPNAIRDRVALLMNAGHWDTAIAWLNAIPDVQISPTDIAAQAAMQLTRGDIDGALNRLRPTTDPDWRRAKVFWQPDRWEDNVAAQMYHLLTGDLAARDGNYEAAVQAYQQAIDAGAAATGQYFLAQALANSGQSEQAALARAEFDAWWPDGTLEPVSLLALAKSNALYAVQPQVTQDEAAQSLAVTAIYSNFRPHNTYPIRHWRIEVVSPDSATRYAEIDTPALLTNPFPGQATTTLALPENISPLSPATVFITPMHSNPVAATPLAVPVTLNRPGDAVTPDEALPVGLQFGDAITLENYALTTDADAIDLTLYWKTDSPLPEDYQVFVHVLDAGGNMLVQADTGPVQNRYPTSQWRTNVTIAAPHTLTVEDLPDDFAIRVGLYRWPDAIRLSVTPADERVQDDSVLLQR